MYSNNNKSNGFTLVELSIVLVIIGLLVGGILIGQSLINTAQINSFIRQIQQYDIAVANFKSTYKCLPADCKSFGGNGDGLITEAGGIQDDTFNGEIGSFWNILTSLKLIKNNVVYSNTATSGIRAGVNVPKSSIGKNTGILVACEWENTVRGGGSDMQDYADWDGKYNYYHIFSTAGTTSDSILTGTAGLDYSLSVNDTLAIDSKMDDGNAIKGDVRVASNFERIAFYNGSPTYNQTAGSGCVLPGDNSKYNMSSTSAYPCALLIPLLSQIGGK